MLEMVQDSHSCSARLIGNYMWPIEYDTIRYDAVDLRALKS